MGCVLNPVFQSLDAGQRRAIGAAVERSVALDAVANNLAAAVGALRRERMDCAFERIEGMSLSLHGHGERLVVIVAADFT